MTFRLGFILVTIALISTSSLAQTGLCPAPNGDFPNPSSELCTTFFRCFQGNPSLLRCPANQRFDFLFRICRPPGVVDCNSQLEVFAAPSIAAGIGGLGRLSTLAGNAGVGGLGGLGAGLPDQGLISLLSQLDGNDDGQNGNNGLATLLMMSALMNQRNSPEQQDANPGIVPLSSIYPIYNELPVASPADGPAQATSQNYEQFQNGFHSDANQGGQLPVTGGKTFIFVPQYPAVQGQRDQHQGQDNIISPWDSFVAPDRSQLFGIQQGANDGQNTLQGQNTYQGQGVLHGQGDLQGQGALQGQDTLQNRGTVQGQAALPNDGSLQDRGSAQGQGALQGIDSLPGPGDWQGQGALQGKGTLQGQGVLQGQGALPGQVAVQGQSALPGQGTLPGQDTLQDGGAVNVQGPLQNQGPLQGQVGPRGRLLGRHRAGLQNRNGFRGRGHVQRQDIQSQLQNLFIQPTGSLDFNTNNASVPGLTSVPGNE